MSLMFSMMMIYDYGQLEMNISIIGEGSGRVIENAVFILSRSTMHPFNAGIFSSQGSSVLRRTNYFRRLFIFVYFFSSFLG